MSGFDRQRVSSVPKYPRRRLPLPAADASGGDICAQRMTKSLRRACTPACIRLDRPRPLRKPGPYGKRYPHHPPYPRLAVDRRGAAATVGRWRAWHGVFRRGDFGPRCGNRLGQSDLDSGSSVHRHLDLDDDSGLAFCVDRFGDRPDGGRTTRRESPGSGIARWWRFAAAVE